jgi:hypothetical protein
MIKTEKIGDELVMTIKCNHNIVDDCFLFANMNAPSEGKQLIMEQVGIAYENYVKNLLSEGHYARGTLEYLNDEFSKIVIENIPTITVTPNELEEIFQDQQVKINEYQLNTKKQACLIKLLLTLELGEDDKVRYCKIFDDCTTEYEIEETYQNIINANSK